MEEEEVTPEAYKPGHEEKGWIFTGKKDGKYQYKNKETDEIVGSAAPPQKYFSYFKETTREKSPGQQAYDEGRRKMPYTYQPSEETLAARKAKAAQAQTQKPPATGIAAQLKAQRERNKKLQKIKANLAPKPEEKPAEATPAEPPAESAGDMKALVRNILDNQTLNAEQKEQKLKQLSVGYEGSVPGNLGVSKVPPAPRFPGEPADPADFPRVPDKSPLSAYFGDAEQQAAEVQQTADDSVLFEQGAPQQTQFIQGASVSGGVDPETGKAVKPFMEKVDPDHPASQAMLAMQQAHKEETGRTLYITSGKRSVEEQMKLHPGWSKEKAMRGQHVHGNAYDIYMAPPEDGPFVEKDGVKYRSGHQLTDEYKWLAANASKFGFVNTAPTEERSGRKEYWHWEYTGPGGTAEYPEEVTHAHAEAAGLPELALEPIPQKKSRLKQAILDGEHIPHISMQKQMLDGDLDSRMLSDTASGVLEQMSRQYAENDFRIDQADTALEEANKLRTASNNLKESINAQYGDTAALIEKQEQEARIIAENKLDLSKKEAQAKQVEADINEFQNNLANTWREMALEEGQKRLEQIDLEIAELKKQDTSPWSMFGFYSTNEETGQEEWDWGKSSFTFVSAMALLANFAATMGSATSKKGGRVPFLVFDMLKAAMDHDTKAQLNSINKTLKGIEKSRAQYKDVYNLYQNQALAANQLRIDKVQGIRDGIAVEKARAKTPEMKAALDMVDEKFAVELRKQQTGRDKAIMDAQAQEANTAIQALNSEKANQRGLQSQYLNGLINLANMRVKREKLSPDQRKLMSNAEDMIPQIMEVEKLWARSGDETLAKMYHKRAPEGMRTLILEMGEKFGKPGSFQTLSDLERLWVIRETYAPKLAKAMGDAGNLAEKEQARAMNQLPMWDSTETGWWKVIRFKQRVLMAASPAYQRLSQPEKMMLRKMILAENDDVEGLKKQVEIQERFLRETGSPMAKQAMGYIGKGGMTSRDKAYQIEQRMKSVRGVKRPDGVTITSKADTDRRREAAQRGQKVLDRNVGRGRTAGEELPDF